jgi:hypothetical protein
VYLDGVRLQEPTAYSPPSTPATSEITYTVTIKEPPTLGDPSFITFSAPVAANTEIYVTRSEAQGNGSTMFRRFDNALPSPETDLNTPISKAPLWGAKNILDGATSSGDWSGGYSVVMDNGVDSAAVQNQITVENDGSPESHVRTNFTAGNTTPQAGNWSQWYKGVTIDATTGVTKNSVGVIKLGGYSANYTDLAINNIQSYIFGGNTSLINTILQETGATHSAEQVWFRRKIGGGLVQMLRLYQASQTLGEANLSINGNFFAGPGGNEAVPTVQRNFVASLADNGFFSVPTQAGPNLIVQFGTFKQRDSTTATHSLPIAFPSRFLHIQTTLKTNYRSSAVTAGGTADGLTKFQSSVHATPSTGLTEVEFSFIAIGY